MLQQLLMVLVSCVSIMKSGPVEGYQPLQEWENNSKHRLLICIWEYKRLHNILYKPVLVLHPGQIWNSLLQWTMLADWLLRNTYLSRDYFFQGPSCFFFTEAKCQNSLQWVTLSMRSVLHTVMSSITGSLSPIRYWYLMISVDTDNKIR